MYIGCKSNNTVVKEYKKEEKKDNIQCVKYLNSIKIIKHQNTLTF